MIWYFPANVDPVVSSSLPCSDCTNCSVRYSMGFDGIRIAAADKIAQALIEVSKKHRSARGSDPTSLIPKKGTVPLFDYLWKKGTIPFLEAEG